MTRTEVESLVGRPFLDTKDITGAFWESTSPIATTELWVYFEHDVAKYVGVERRTGSTDNFYRQRLRSEELR